MRNKIENFLDFIFLVVKILCGAALLFMVTTVTAQVIIRALGGNIRWCEEVMLILLCMMMFLLLPLGVKEDLHIRVGVFAKHFPKSVRVMLVYVSNIVIAIVSIFMIYYGIMLMTKTHSKFNVTGLPKKYLYLFTVISGGLTLLVAIAKCFGVAKTRDQEDFIEGTDSTYETIDSMTEGTK